MSESERPLRLIVDVLSAPASSGGMRAYAEEVISAWNQIPGAQDDELIVHGEPWIEESFAGLPGVATVAVRNPNRAKRLTLQWFGTARLYRVRHADAVLSLGPVVTGLVPRSRTFCVVHDWRHIKNPQEFSRATRAYRRVWLLSMARAQTVFAISDKTARVTREQVPSANVLVVPNGADHPRRWPLTEPERGERAVVTFGHHPNKRPDLVLRAYAELPVAERQRTPLVILGAKGAWAQELKSLAGGLGVRDEVRLPGFVSDAEYQRTISRAAAVVMASTDEGFGLPVVEAKYFRIPVVATVDSGLGEVHTDIALCEPTPAALGEALRSALDAGLTAPAAPRAWADVASELRASVSRAVPSV